MGKLSINYIETTLNGHIIKRVKIADFIKGKDYLCELKFNLDGKDLEYYDDIAGDWEDLELFLYRGNHSDCISYSYENHLNTKENVYLEYYITDSLGYYEDRYIGIEVSNQEETN